MSGCEAPWSLYAEKAIPQSKEILLAFLGLSSTEIVKEFFRPQGPRTKRHGRKGRKSGGPRGGIPDPNERIAQRLRMDTDLWRPKYNVPTGVFYEVGDVIDRAAWTVALLEMSEELIYETLLGVLEGDKTFCPSISRLHRFSGFHTEGGPGPDWAPINQSGLHYKVGVISDTGFSARVDPGSYSLTFGCKALRSTTTNWVKIRLRESLPPFRVLAESPETETPVGETVDLLIHANVEGPMSFVWEVTEDTGFWFAVESDVLVLEIV